MTNKKRIVLILTRTQLKNLKKSMRGTTALILDLKYISKEQVQWYGEAR